MGPCCGICVASREGPRRLRLLVYIATKDHVVQIEDGLYAELARLYEENTKQAKLAQNYEKLKELCDAATKSRS